MSADEPLFLSRAQIERLHDMSLARFGGAAGVGDEGLIQSALASAKNALLRQGDLFGIAAAYAFHLAEAQAFIDGNKRTGIGAALAFLEVNGVRTTADDDMLYNAMIDIANKRLTKAGLAAIPRGHAVKMN